MYVKFVIAHHRCHVTVGVVVIFSVDHCAATVVRRGSFWVERKVGGGEGGGGGQMFWT